MLNPRNEEFKLWKIVLNVNQRIQRNFGIMTVGTKSNIIVVKNAMNVLEL